MSAARHFARSKPIVVVKAGRFRESARAVASHTGSLSGEDEIYDAAFKRAGIVRVEEITELFNAAGGPEHPAASRRDRISRSSPTPAVRAS